VGKGTNYSLFMKLRKGY